MTTKTPKYPKYIMDEVNKLAENFPNAVVTIVDRGGTYYITEIDIDGKYTESMRMEQYEINDALEEKRMLNSPDYKIALD